MAGRQGNSLTVITDSEGKANVNIKSKIVGSGTLTAVMKMVIEILSLLVLHLISLQPKLKVSH